MNNGRIVLLFSAFFFAMEALVILGGGFGERPKIFDINCRLYCCDRVGGTPRKGASGSDRGNVEHVLKINWTRKSLVDEEEGSSDGGRMFSLCSS